MLRSSRLIAQKIPKLIAEGIKYFKYIKYGYLYNWHAVNKAVAEDDDGYSLAPEGWHVPTDAEWTTLSDYIDTNYSAIGVSNHLKHPRKDGTPVLSSEYNTSTHPRWNANATHYGRDTVLFGALPGGHRTVLGSFDHLGTYGFWWSSSGDSSTTAWRQRMGSYDGAVNRFANVKTRGFSVRLIRDNDTGWVEGETVEIDGYTYDTVKIGTQVWMVQNLATTKYRNGEDIPNVTDNTDWANDEAGARCAYNNDEGNVFATFKWL